MPRWRLSGPTPWLEKEEAPPMERKSPDRQPCRPPARGIREGRTLCRDAGKRPARTLGNPPDWVHPGGAGAREAGVALPSTLCGRRKLFVVLEGEGTLRYDDEEFPIRSGDMVLTPPGPDTAHQIINTSETKLRYLALSGKAKTGGLLLPGFRKVRRVPWRVEGRRVHRQGRERGRLLARRDNRAAPRLLSGER